MISLAHLDLFAGLSWLKNQGPLTAFIVCPGIGGTIFCRVVHIESVLARAPLKDHPDAHGATVLCALVLGTFKTNVRACGQVSVLTCRATCLLSSVFLQYVPSTDQHARGLYSVEGATLLLLDQGGVVGHLDQLVHVFVWVFLFQVFEDAKRLFKKNQTKQLIYSDVRFCQKLERF